MSFFGSHEEAKKWARENAKVIDDLDSSSPIRDGGDSTGNGAPPIGGTVEFTQTRTRTGIHDTQKSMRRSYGLDHDAKSK